MRIACTGTDIRCTRRDILTTGMVGLTAEFHFNSEWDGISGKTAVFRSGDVAKEVLILSSGVVTVPWEVFHTAGEKLLVGVYGTDGEGNTWPAPTPYCDAGEIRKGTESAEAGEDPTPSVVDQIMAAAAEAESVAQSVRDDADSGAFDGADGRDGADGADGHGLVILGLYATLAALQSAHPTAGQGDVYAVGTAASNVLYVWDGAAWVNLGALAGPQGPKGDAGEAGPNTITSATTTTFNGVLAGNGSTVTTRAVSSSVTGGSTALVTSGAVYTAMQSAKPRVGTITLSATWSGSGPYTQTVTVTGATVTANSRVDLQPGAAALAQLADDGVAALWVENSSGTLTAYAIGAAPSAALTVQCTVTEVTA